MPINKLGKRGKINAKANRKLKQLFMEKGIITCELRLSDCTFNNFLGWAHRKKRREYYSTPEQLSDFNEVILACTNCHNKIEYDKELTQEVFEKLR